MKFHAPLIAVSLVASLSAADVPKIFAGLFEPDIPVKGQIGVVAPPPEIDKYDAKVGNARLKDPKWFREFCAQTKPGDPLPFDERLGLTKEEYAEYLVLWAKRDFRPLADVMLLLGQRGDTWAVTATGRASPISTLRYLPKDDVFRSPNGELKRLKDVKVDASGILGAWSGQEWRFEEDTGLGKTLESVAIGRFADNKFAIIFYHVQEVSTEGTVLLDKSLVVRFALGKAGQLKDPKAAPTKPTKTETGKGGKSTPKK